MASSKKRKISDEGRVFQKEWTNVYFFVEIHDKPVCLICAKQISAKKKINLKHHYDSISLKLSGVSTVSLRLRLLDKNICDFV